MYREIVDKVMALILSKDGIKSVPGLTSYIGKDADDSVEQISKDLYLRKACDCIGYCGYRNITMIGMEKRIDIVCETDNREEIANDTIAPHEVKWIIIDIFEFITRPINGKGFY